MTLFPYLRLCVHSHITILAENIVNACTRPKWKTPTAAGTARLSWDALWRPPAAVQEYQNDPPSLELQVSGFMPHHFPVSCISVCMCVFCRFCLLPHVWLSVQSPSAHVGEPFHGEYPSTKCTPGALIGSSRQFSVNCDGILSKLGLLFSPCLSCLCRGMFTPVGGRQKILSSDPPVSPPFPSLSGNWRRSCCHFNASEVFLPFFFPLFLPPPPQGRVTHPRRPPSPICLRLRVCGEEKQKNKQKCANAVNKIPVCMCESVGLLCLCHVTYVKRCLCASRRHLRALWESRRLYDFSFLLRCTHLYYTHTHVLLLLFAFISCLEVQKKERDKKNPSAHE